MPDESAPKPTPPPPITTTSALTAAIVAIGALLPNKIAATSVGMLAPFISSGIIWLGYEQAKQWLAERKAQAPTRRAERYLKQMRRDWRKLADTDAEKLMLHNRILQLTDMLHEHRMSGLEIKSISTAVELVTDTKEKGPIELTTGPLDGNVEQG